MFLKVIWVIALIIVAFSVYFLIKNYVDSRKSSMKDDYYMDFESDASLEKKYAGLGSYEVSSLVLKSDDKTIRNIRIWYPTELESSGQSYPLITVTNASNTAALNYMPFFQRLASWGFIVAGNDDRQAGSGASSSYTLDYILSMNNDSTSVLYNKVNVDSIGCIGYSQGGAGAINAVTNFDNSYKYKTLFTGSAAYPLLSKNMGWEYDASMINIPCFVTAGTGNSDDTGIASIDDSNVYAGVCPLESLIYNYNLIDSDVFKLRARAAGAEHGEMQTRTDGYMTAWMLYHLYGDEEAGKAFIGESAEILINSSWQDVEKNR